MYQVWASGSGHGHAFLSDDAFRAELTTRNMYRFSHRDAVLERLENHGRRETVSLSSYTVDHIMPQGERLLYAIHTWLAVHRPMANE